MALTAMTMEHCLFQAYNIVTSIAAPILFVGDYYFSPEEKFSPFVGLGIGVTYNEINTEMGQYYVDTDTWQFSLAPEVGVQDGRAQPEYGVFFRHDITIVSKRQS